MNLSNATVESVRTFLRTKPISSSVRNVDSLQFDSRGIEQLLILLDESVFGFGEDSKEIRFGQSLERSDDGKTSYESGQARVLSKSATNWGYGQKNVDVLGYETKRD